MIRSRIEPFSGLTEAQFAKLAATYGRTNLTCASLRDCSGHRSPRLTASSVTYTAAGHLAGASAPKGAVYIVDGTLMSTCDRLPRLKSWKVLDIARNRWKSWKVLRDFRLKGSGVHQSPSIRFTHGTVRMRCPTGPTRTR